MARNLTNMNNTNVYVNTNLSANAPVVVNQTSFNNPITVSIKGLNALYKSNYADEFIRNTIRMGR